MIFLTILVFTVSAFAAPAQLKHFGQSDVSGTNIIQQDNTRDILVDQQPNQVNGLFCDAAYTQVIAENFVLAADETIAQIVVWGGYFPNNIPMAPDYFTVAFHNDAAGAIGTMISTELDVPHVRVQTGLQLFGVDEWMYTLTLATPVPLTAGTYWIEFYNTTLGGYPANDTYFWETGNLDPVNGILGSAWATTAPGSGWNFDAATDLSMQLISAVEQLDPPQNLAVECIDDYAHFTWEAPGTSTGFADGFETYDDFVLEFAPWTLVDVDGSVTYYITGYTFPNQGYVGSYIIFNPSQVSPPLTDAPTHSGDKMAACFASAGPTYLNDDWMITPQITITNGDEVSFFAKSYTDDYGLERFNVAVSTTGTAPADFTVISAAPYVEAPIEWTEYNYDLSSYAGQSVYVAIQCVTADAFIFFVDDFHVGPPADVVYAKLPIMNGSAGKGICEFIPGKIVSTTDNSRDLIGYEVYLDGVFVDTTTDLEWDFYGLINGEFYDAGVLAVYDDGNSDLVEINFEYTGTGTDDIIVATTQLNNNYPNPFNPVTNIAFSLSEPGHVTLEVYNIKGEKVRTLVDKVLAANNHVITWNGKDTNNKSVSSGVYFYKMKAEKYTSTKKMILMK